MLAQISFLISLSVAFVLFSINAKKIIRNIRLGKPLSRSDHPRRRWLQTLQIALGQTKMVKRPVAGVLHIIVYAGFILINIEVLEIGIDGLFGTHRFFSFMGSFYTFLINALEWLALAVLIACIVFLIRRNVLKLRRFFGVEMTSWPRSDANYILIAEILLMVAFITLNAVDYRLQLNHVKGYTATGAFTISSLLSAFLPNHAVMLIFLERFCWWFHILGIFAFLNYLPYSKHFHILLAFPNVWYAKLKPQGALDNMVAVTHQVHAMLDSNFSLNQQDLGQSRFGAKDIGDLSWKSLLDAYTCTECGRCTSVCPANLTGKLLSPRKVMMDTRDRLSEVGKYIQKHGQTSLDGKSLLDDYISREEIWACTTCNACVEACPVSIDPLAIIMELRRYVIMEEGSSSLNNMFNNIENNGAPWKYAAADRANWIQEIKN